MLNGLLKGLVVSGDDSTTTVANYLDEDFFVTLCKYAINYTNPTIANETENPTEAEQTAIGNIKAWTVSKSDVLMYILSTVCTNDFLQFIIDVAKLKAPEDPNAINPVDIVLGLAGKQNELVDLIIMLLTQYTLQYQKFAQEDIKKIAVEQPGNASKEEIGNALTILERPAMKTIWRTRCSILSSRCLQALKTARSISRRFSTMSETSRISI